MKVVVTGACGHLGANLVRQLIAQGHDVRAVSRHAHQAPALAGLNVEKFSADMRDFNSVCSALEGCEILYHLAAIISIDGDQNGAVTAVNVGGTENVALAAYECGVKRMIHISSIHAFDQYPTNEPLDETRPRVTGDGKHPAYDRSKAAGEQAVRNMIEKGLDAVILHPTGVIGPMDFAPSRMGQALLALHQNKMLGLIKGGFNWVDVRDVINSILSATTHGRCGESYILGGHWHSVKELAEMVTQATGAPTPSRVFPMWLARLAAPFAVMASKFSGTEPLFTAESLLALRANQNILSIKAEQELGHNPRPIQETISDLFTWFSEKEKSEPVLMQESEITL